MRREWKAERMKVKRRGIGLLLAAFWGVTMLWLYWGVSQMSGEALQDGYRTFWMNLSTINSVLLPTMAALLASRLCDEEIKGNTLKLLCTLEAKGRIYDVKLLLELQYLLLYVLAELLLVAAGGPLLGFGNPLEAKHILRFLLQTLSVTGVLLLLQTALSFLLENQILPLATGILGSFVALFSWFLPTKVTAFLWPWGYYSRLIFQNFTWDETTRVMQYYDVPLNPGAVAVLLGTGVFCYIVGKILFLRKEI